MIDVLTGYAQNVLVLLGALTAITVALGTVWRKGIRPVSQKVETVLTKVEKVLAIAEYEFTPNGGKSTADKLMRLEENLEAQQEKNVAIATALDERTGVVDDRLGKIDQTLAYIGTEFVRREKGILIRLDKIDAAGHVAADANVVITTDAKVEVIERIDNLEHEMKDVGP